MKKLLLLIAFVSCTALYTFAQTQKGDLVIGSNFNAGLGYGYRSVLFNGGINPDINYFLNKRLSIGFGAEVSGSITLHDDSFGDYSSFRIYVGPSVRYYLTKTKLQPFIGLSSGFSMFGYNNDMKYYEGIGYFVKPEIGLLYPVTKRVSLMAKIDYDFMNTADFNAKNRMQMKVGIAVKLGK